MTYYKAKLKGMTNDYKFFMSFMGANNKKCLYVEMNTLIELDETGGKWDYFMKSDHIETEEITKDQFIHHFVITRNELTNNL